MTLPEFLPPAPVTLASASSRTIVASLPVNRKLLPPRSACFAAPFVSAFGASTCFGAKSAGTSALVMYSSANSR